MIVGDNGIGFDETKDQEDYNTYMNYISLVEETGLNEEDIMHMMQLTHADVDMLISKFEIEEV